MERTKDKIKKTKMAKKTGFKPKSWVVKLIKEHKVLMEALKDR
jgi:hypothetical protein